MNSERLQGPVVDLLLDLATERLIVPEPMFSPLQGGQWAEHSLESYSGEISRDGSALKLLIDTPEGELFHGPLHAMMQVRNKSIQLLLRDESRIEAELAHMGKLGAKADVELHHWIWTAAADTRPQFWIGRLEGPVPPGGNLALVERSSNSRSSQRAFRLQGGVTWYLLNTVPRSKCIVVVDANGREFSREELIRDVQCLELALGGPVKLECLVGIDAQRATVAARAVGHMPRASGKHRCPVPDDVFQADEWMPGFFQLLAKRIHEPNPEALIIGIVSYLDAETDHLDGAYLKAQVGLEAIAKRLVGEGTPEIIVRDEAEWRTWLATLKSVMRQHLSDPKKFDAVYGKFVSAMYAPSGDLVKRAFDHYAVPLPAEQIAEVKKRNYPAHGFLMNSELEYDFDADVRRLEMVQTMIVALLACHVGYSGPIKGYDVEAGGHRPSPTWWPVTTTKERFATSYLAERTLSDEVAGGITH
jgi:hypothetical protein